MNIVDEAKLHSQICSTFEVLVVWRVVGHCGGVQLGPFSWPMPAAVIAVFDAFHQLLSILLRCNGFSGFKKLFRKPNSDQLGSRPSNSDYELFECKFGFGKGFGASSWSNNWAVSCWLLDKIHFSWHVTIKSRNGTLLLHTIREHDTSKWQFLWIAVSSWGTHL